MIPILVVAALYNIRGQSMQHCETCKFWGHPDDRDDDPDQDVDEDPHPLPDFRTCGAVVHDKRGLRHTPEVVDYELGPAGSLVAVRRHDPERAAFRAANKAVAVDGSGYFAALKPRRDFGCVLHEAASPEAR